MGGDIRVDSTYSKGARFIFTHPLKQEETDEETGCSHCLVWSVPPCLCRLLIRVIVLRDSIFHVYRSMPADTTRTVFAKEAAMGHVKESWALELLDSALVFAREIKDVEGELEPNTGFFVTIRSGMDGENMEKTCASLREACYRYKKYDNYFLALHYVLQLKGSEGTRSMPFLNRERCVKKLCVCMSTVECFVIYHGGKVVCFRAKYGKSNRTVSEGT